MPYDVRKESGGGGYKTYNKSTGHVYGHHMTHKNAIAQQRLLYMKTHGEGITKSHHHGHGHKH
jgi:hypothetical protein